MSNICSLRHSSTTRMPPSIASPGRARKVPWARCGTPSFPRRSTPSGCGSRRGPDARPHRSALKPLQPPVGNVRNLACQVRQSLQRRPTAPPHNTGGTGVRLGVGRLRQWVEKARPLFTQTAPTLSGSLSGHFRISIRHIDSRFCGAAGRSRSEQEPDPAQPQTLLCHPT